MRSRIFQVALALSAALLPCQRLFAESSTKAPLVLAAASLQESLNAIADRWANAGHVRPVIALAASSQLARQIEAGAPADLFISADEQWMDDVAAHGQIVPSTRLNLVGNALVLIAPVHAPQHVNLKYGASILSLLGGGRLAMADPDAVPAGIYGKAAMQNLGLWNSVRNRVAKGANVRSALLLVDREEAPLGIVYAT
ncbi:MAG: molybdate ABC transporter substrate-binding protein, partial [Alphaproteobacteria bacterium]|nr:molybdate ABC transporter substrate-binding protein [Alphaproteobacteria bacterium]